MATLLGEEKGPVGRLDGFQHRIAEQLPQQDIARAVAHDDQVGTRFTGERQQFRAGMAIDCVGLGFEPMGLAEIGRILKQEGLPGRPFVEMDDVKTDAGPGVQMEKVANGLGRFHAAAVSDQRFLDRPVGVGHRQDRAHPLAEQFDDGLVRILGEAIVEDAAQSEDDHVVVAGFGNHGRKRIALFVHDSAADHVLAGTMRFERRDGRLDALLGDVLLLFPHALGIGVAPQWHGAELGQLAAVDHGDPGGLRMVRLCQFRCDLGGHAGERCAAQSDQNSF